MLIKYTIITKNSFFTRLQSCGSVGVWRCGSVDLWRYGSVEVWKVQNLHDALKLKFHYI